MSHTYSVREVKFSDLPVLVEIERERWTREGTEILDYVTLKEWYDSHSPFFLVAEADGRVDGFYYAIQVNFSPDSPEEYMSPDMQTHRGWSIHTHDPYAKSVYAVNIVQRATQAGIALNRAMHALSKKRGMRYFIGTPRLVNFDHYIREVERQSGGTLPYDEESIALWYAHESLKLLKQTKIWAACPAQPTLNLPRLKRPDSLLKFSVENLHAGLLGIIPNLMKDPKSRGYGAFMASDFTHI